MAAVAALAPIAAATEPRDAKPATKGTSTLDGLKSRSPAERWDDLEKPDVPRTPQPALQIIPAVPKSADKPSSAPFPREDEQPVLLPEPKSAVVIEPKQYVPRRRAASSALDAIDFPQDQKPAPRTRDTLDVLRPLSEISPFPDYVPSDYQRPKQDRTPAATWEARAFERRQYASVLFKWDASNLTHNPLYFEDVPLERYGHTYHEVVQPFASAALFSAQLLGLPYQATIDPVCKEIYTLGYYRPGEACVPKLLYRVPWNAEAAGVEAGVATGLFFLIP